MPPSWTAASSSAGLSPPRAGVPAKPFVETTYKVRPLLLAFRMLPALAQILFALPEKLSSEITKTLCTIVNYCKVKLEIGETNEYSPKCKGGWGGTEGILRRPLEYPPALQQGRP